VLGALEIAVESTQYFFWVYIGLNVVVAGLLLGMRWMPVAVLEWSVFTISLVDGIFLSALTLVTGGPDSILYWLFLALIVRSAASVPRPTSQLMLNLTLCAYYVLAGVVEIALAKNLEDSGTPVMDLPDRPAEHLVLQTALLLLMTLCCYGLQVLFERQRQALDQAREFATREAQLRSAGRLAAEFAHQIKNPLAIINNAAFSLQRGLKDRPGDFHDQIHMIQEEVERADRIITQVMGYAQLTEGRVEKLNVIEELDQALKEVFPPAANYGIQVHRQYGSQFPPLLMQRRHVSETFLNLLQNAREALNGEQGNVFVEANCRSDYAIEVSIGDDGPGIPSDKHEKIFDAYYTTKDKGTGLGLATVKHNVELYGGSVRVDSELGKGARFVVTFPARTLIKLAKPL
jgi:signal transduction histidine kinase